MPLYVMLVTSFKDMDEIRSGNIIILYLKNSKFLCLAQRLGQQACTGFVCEGLKPGLVALIENYQYQV